METYNYMSIYTIILTSIWVFYTYLYLDIGVHTIIFIYIYGSIRIIIRVFTKFICFNYTWVYLQIYEKLYIHRNNVIVHVYEHLYLGILAII